MVSSKLRLREIQCLALNSVSTPVERCVATTRLHTHIAEQQHQSLLTGTLRHP